MPSEFNFIPMLAQSETERLLAQQLTRQGVKVERGAEVTSVRRADVDQPVEVTLRSADGSEEVLTASYLIAADGPHSTIRNALGVPFPGRTLPHNYVLADLHVDGAVPQDQVSTFPAGGGFIAVFPMGNGRFRLMATDPDETVGDGEPTVPQIRQLYDRTVHVPARLHTLNWSSRFRINSRHVRALRSGRVLFGGDAAEVGRAWDGVVTVREGHATERGSWLLVRPDGYLAAAGVDAVQLDRWLGTGSVARDLVRQAADVIH